MTTARPVLSVVIPVYNRARSIGATVASVLGAARAARLGAGELEVIVVDDGSADGSADAAAAAGGATGPAVTVIRQPNAGPAAARNRGVTEARAPHVAFVDSDDVWFDWTLEVCLGALAAHPDAALFFLKPRVFSDALPLRPVHDGATRLDRHDGFVAASRGYGRRSFGTNNVIVRRDVFERLGGFAVEFRCLEDTDLFLRADTAGPCIVMTGDDLIGRRRGDRDSLTDNWACVVDGLDRMKRKEAAGLYPHGAHGDPRRVEVLAGAAVRATRLCFANGRPGKAYAVFFRNLGPILRGGRARWALRLPLTPVLSMLRPRHYPFRLRPAPASRHAAI